MEIACRKRLLIFIVVLCFSPLSIHAQSAKPLHVTVSILPQKYIVQRIAGNTAEVLVLVQPGYSPETYEPTARQLISFNSTDIYFQIGVPFEKLWLTKIAPGKSNFTAFEMQQGIKFRNIGTLEQSEHHELHNHDALIDPHVWLSPELILQLAGNVKKVLSGIKPEHSEMYEENYNSLAENLKQLDARVRKMLESADIREFLVFHPSWGYFADHYGLKQVAIESEGKTPSAKSYSGIIQYAKEHGLKTVFVQKQFSSKAAANIAKAIGGRVITVDPLAEDILGSLDAFAKKLAEQKNE